MSHFVNLSNLPQSNTILILAILKQHGGHYFFLLDLALGLKSSAF